jgi:2-polyprenyl-6-methoxyphenol hydroxylase-like FAD-dependent oxidoreductase
MNTDSERKHVVTVGADFAGLGCAPGLAKSDEFRVTLTDRNNLHHFQPLPDQLATAQLGRGTNRSLHRLGVELSWAVAGGSGPGSKRRGEDRLK